MKEEIREETYCGAEMKCILTRSIFQEDTGTFYSACVCLCVCRSSPNLSPDCLYFICKFRLITLLQRHMREHLITFSLPPHLHLRDEYCRSSRTAANLAFGTPNTISAAAFFFIIIIICVTVKVIKPSNKEAKDNTVKVVVMMPGKKKAETGARVIFRLVGLEKKQHKSSSSVRTLLLISLN